MTWAIGMTLAELDEFADWLAADWERRFREATPDALPAGGGKRPEVPPKGDSGSLI